LGASREVVKFPLINFKKYLVDCRKKHTFVSTIPAKIVKLEIFICLYMPVKRQPNKNTLLSGRIV